MQKKDEKLKKIERAPASEVARAFFEHALANNAGKIHFDPQPRGAKIRYRVDGSLQDVFFFPDRIFNKLSSFIKDQSGLKVRGPGVYQTGKFDFNLGNKKINAEVAAMPTTHGEKITLGISYRFGNFGGLREIGLSDEHTSILNKYSGDGSGAIFVTGPTGSGKSSTIHFLTDVFNKEGTDPILLDPDSDSDISRIDTQDPDIILIEGMHNRSLVEVAIRTALKGKLVLSTFHVHGRAGVVPTLLDMGLDSNLLASSLNLIISQSLVRRLCPHCKKLVDATPEEKLIMEEELSGLNLKTKTLENLCSLEKVCHAHGCDKCNGEGYRGRIGIFEFLPATARIREVLAKNPSSVKIEEVARDEGLPTMAADGMLKVLQGITTVDEVIRATEI